MKKIIVILMVIMGYSLYAQVKTLPFNGNILTTDQFGFYYEVKNTEINKYAINGKLNCSYSNNILGVIASVDVSNPQKIIVYFKDVCNNSYDLDGELEDEGLNSSSIEFYD